jgi:hypothetical protein
MKKYILILGVLFITVAVYSQEDTVSQVMTKQEQRQLAKEYRQAARTADEKAAKEATELMMQQHKFVLEADYLSGRTGQRYPVSSTLNFIKVDSTEAVLQLGSSSGMGYNGVGGITVDGNITRYEINKKEGKRGTTYNLTLYIMSNLGTYDVQLWISANGQADATVRSTTRGSLSYSGRLVPLDESRVYKGTSL